MHVLFHFNNKALFIILPLILLLSCCNKNDSKVDTGIGKPPDPIDPTDTTQTFYHGVDLSFQPQIEEYQTIYLDEDSSAIDLLPYLKSKGINLVRLRLWHTPENIHSSLEEVLAYSEKIKQAGMGILLDIHYSDTWADPGNQEVPAAWSNLSFSEIKDSVYQYTFKVLKEFKDQNTFPVIVQIGNETNSGFLWDQGKVGGDFENNWPNYIDLVNIAIKGVRDIDENDEVEVMIHWAGLNGAIWYFDHFEQANVDFDIIGLSYYSKWHGNDLGEVENQIVEISQNFTQKIMVVETAYPWTLEWNDWTNNSWGLENQLIPGYPATPEGQKMYMEELINIIGDLNQNKGLGFCYWAPDWVAYKGPEATDGSIWENAAIFDFNNKILPVIESFNME